MPSEKQQRTRVQEGDGYARKQQVTEYNPSTQEVIVNRVNQLLWLLSGILNALIGLRVILRAVAANPGNAFASFTYRATEPFLLPFETLFNNPEFTNGAVIEITSLVAIVVYILATWALVSLVQILFSDAGGTKTVRTVEQS